MVSWIGHWVCWIGQVVTVPAPPAQTVGCVETEQLVGSLEQTVIAAPHAVGVVTQAVASPEHSVGVRGQVVGSTGHWVVCSGQTVLMRGHCVGTLGGHCVAYCG
jgi:hypothetical protein